MRAVCTLMCNKSLWTTTKTQELSCNRLILGRSHCGMMGVLTRFLFVSSRLRARGSVRLVLWWKLSLLLLKTWKSQGRSRHRVPSPRQTRLRALRHKPFAKTVINCWGFSECYKRCSNQHIKYSDTIPSKREKHEDVTFWPSRLNYRWQRIQPSAVTPGTSVARLHPVKRVGLSSLFN